MTAPAHSLHSSPSTFSEGLDQHTHAVGMPFPKVDEKCAFRAFKTFLGKIRLIVPLRARDRGLSTVAHSNKTLECQAKNDLHPTRNQTKTGAFSGAHLTAQLGSIWGAIKTHFNVTRHITLVCMGGDRR